MRHTVEVTLGDRARHLRYDLNAFALIKQRTGVNLFDAGDDNKMSQLASDPEGLRTLLWAGLVHEDKELTEEQVGGWVDISNFGELASKFEEAFSLAGQGELRASPQRGRRKTNP